MNSIVRIAAMAVVFCAGATFSTAALAQSAGGGAGGALQSSGAQSPGNHMGQNNMTQEQFNQLSDYVDQSKRLTKEDRAKGKTEADLKAEDEAAAAAIVKALPLPCVVSDAQLYAQGSQTVNGQTQSSATYEVACANGTGYFVVSQAPLAPYALSCFTADAKRAADAAKGQATGAVCKLPANADINASAAALLAKSGKTCSVRQIAWLGFSANTNTEYNEIACTDGNGYVLATALAGSVKAPRAMTCKDAAPLGIPCTLPGDAPAAPAITIQTFKDALVQYHVSCDAANVHVIGQQNKSKRYVVEFQCAQHPAGLVAFIPLSGNTAPFETLDCAAALKAGAVCTLHQTH